MRIDKDTVIFITGGGSGFGLVTAQRFYALGCVIVMADITFSEQATEFLKEVQKERVLVLNQYDVTNEEVVEQGVNEAIAKFKKIDLLLNSAGVSTLGFTVNKSGRVIDNSEIWRVLKINIIGTVNASKYVARHMINYKTTDDRLIVNVASIAALEASKGMLAYAASKGGVVGLTLPMARDLGKYGIRVVTLAPQVFDTPMGRLISQKALEFNKKQAALERLGDPQEFADSVISMAEATYLTGVVIRLDGGFRGAHI